MNTVDQRTSSILWTTRHVRGNGSNKVNNLLQIICKIQIPKKKANMFLTTKPNLENSTTFCWTKPEYSYCSSNRNRKLHFITGRKKKGKFLEKINLTSLFTQSLKMIALGLMQIVYIKHIQKIGI